MAEVIQLLILNLVVIMACMIVLWLISIPLGDVSFIDSDRDGLVNALDLDDDQLDDPGADDAGHVVDQESLRTHQPLEVAAEHPQAEHVEEYVAKVVGAVQETVGNELPRHE